MKRVVILGSTGSIGTQTLDVIHQHPSELKVVGLASKSNALQLAEQAGRFGVKQMALSDESFESRDGIKRGRQAIIDMVTDPDVDLVVVAVAGMAGLVPTLAAIQSKKQIALASKEVLVAAGELVMPLIKQNNILLTPIDSEHSALLQCLQGYKKEQVSEVILTASGGPFKGKKKYQLENVTVKEALNHPTWKMGGKITVDCATLMNKALEMIEAKWLFDLSMDQIQAVIHPQSIIHSFVKFKDGSVLGQFGWQDMRLPIQYALLYPERVPNELRPWNPLDTPNLSFEKIDETTFGAFSLARKAMEQAGTMPCVYNAANEAAVNAFLKSEIRFLEIVERVDEVMSQHISLDASLENLIEADQWAREAFQSKIKLSVTVSV